MVWLERLPETPQRGVILANEVLDALPFKRFGLHADVRELGVVQRSAIHSPGRLPRCPWRPNCATGCRGGLPHGYVSEICPLAASPGSRASRACLDRGGMLLFDYGLPRPHYYHPQRTEGTLRCHFKQRAHADPFINVAVQDITAWVDFTHVARSCRGSRTRRSPASRPRRRFLLAMGIEQ